MKKIAAIIISGAILTRAEPKPPTTDPARSLLAAVLILEAGGEIDSSGNSRRAMSAVWEVIWRRAELRRKSRVGVVTRRKQFSCLNSIEPGRAIATAQKHPMWRHALGIVSAPPLQPDGKLLTLGAEHYHAKSVSPYWADEKKKTVTIGNHVFYKLGY